MLRLIYLSAFIIAIIACEKEMTTKCGGNCGEVRFSGRIYDSSNAKGMANVPLKVYWQDQGLCFICPEMDVAHKKTDRDGYFDFTVTIDTTTFGRFGLNISAPVPGGYIIDGSIYPPVDQEYRMGTGISSYSSTFSDIRFVVYQKADLEIQLQRTLNDGFTWFDMGYVYNHTHMGLYSTYSQAPTTTGIDFNFNVATAAGLYTKVDWTKLSAPGQKTTFLDSIKCVANTKNVIVVRY